MLSGEAYAEALCSGRAGVDVTGLGGFCFRCCWKAVMLSDVTSLPALLQWMWRQIEHVQHRQCTTFMHIIIGAALATSNRLNSLLQREEVVCVAELCGTDTILRSQVSTSL